MANLVQAFDGKSWTSGTARYWDGKAWSAVPVPRIWDGVGWQTSRPPAVGFPIFVASSQASYRDTDTARLALPSSVRLGDTVVSICASYGADTPTPHGVRSLVAAAPSPQGLTFDPTRLHMQASMYEWTPARGSSVSWRLSGAPDTNAIVMNLVYRGTDTSALPAQPIVDYTTAMTTDRIPLQAGTGSQSLYIAVALSAELTGGQWPAGFTNPIEAFGQFGDAQVHMMAAHTVSSTSSPGALQLDATVPEVAVALLTIPGKPQSDGHGVWILDDTTASVLGTTTYLE